MYVWSIKNPGEQAVQTLRMAKSCRCANRTIVRELKSFLASNVVAHDELLQLLNAGLNSLTNDIGSKKERVFIVECAAAFDYAFRHKNAGTFMLVRGAMVCSKRKNTICDYIRMKGTAILKNYSTNAQKGWFLLRSLVMDAYSSAILTTHKYQFTIWYGGSNHVEGIVQLLLLCGYRVKDPAHINQCESAFLRQASCHLTMVAFLTNGEQDVLFLGENHFKTDAAFVLVMRAYLNSRCNSASFAFMVERHELSTFDSIEEELACNMQDLPIHNIRCNVVATFKAKCSKVHIYYVDNRHFDMSFLPFSLLSLTNDPEYVAAAARFFCTACLQTINAANIWKLLPVTL